MSNFNMFMKDNKIVKKNTTYTATKSLTDKSGNALPWTIKPLTTKENDRIRDDCTIEVPVPGKQGMYRPQIDTSKFMAKLICASVVEPDLHDKDLQDSYGVMTPEALIVEMVDNPGEYSDFASFIQEFNGFTDFGDKVQEAKN
ncbi:MAG: hypothetical protein RR012_01165 [Oscillospiraceae bacterium]